MWEGFFTGYLNYGLNCREKNEEIISRNSLPHYKRASSFTNKPEAAWLHLLPNLSRYRRMSESVQHDEQGSSLHDRWCLRYDEQCSSLHAEGLKLNSVSHSYHWNRRSPKLMHVLVVVDIGLCFCARGWTEKRPKNSRCLLLILYRYYRQCTYDVTLRLFRVIVVTVGRQ